jgi:hypothetical protein
MKVLILVQAFKDGPYSEITALQKKTWDSVENPATQTIFYMADFDPPIQIQGKDYYVKEIPYTPFGFIHFMKTLIYAMDFEWDFIFKTNSNTYVDKANLVNFLETLPKEKLVLGHPYWKQFADEYSKDGDPAELGEFMWGDGYIISRDVAVKLIDMYSLNPRGLMVTDEYGITYALCKQFEIKYEPIIRLYPEEGLGDKKGIVYRVVPKSTVIGLWDNKEYEKTIFEIHNQLTQE